jgi:hypothetical protein
MSLYQTIRAALETRAVTAAGFPGSSQRAYEGVIFAPTLKTTYARMTNMPALGRPFSVSAARKEHIGTFQVDLFGAPGAGAGAIESLADAVKAVFSPGLRLPKNGEIIIIDWSERVGIISADPKWLQCPVSVRWRCFSASN